MRKAKLRKSNIDSPKNQHSKPDNNSSCTGRLAIIGIGPGDNSHLTQYAKKNLASSDAIVGYKTYVDFIEKIAEGKPVYATGMTQEAERCIKAIELAFEGKKVALISGGDAGVYGMAGLVFELLKNRFKTFPDLDVEVIPGVSSIMASAAALGAPLMHDFVVISLSDILTPWEKITKRLYCAVDGDFVVVLLNPKSKKRTSQIVTAREIALKVRGEACPVGIVSNAGRKNEEVHITNLNDMLNFKINMTTTVIIGNSETYEYKKRMVTPRIR